MFLSLFCVFASSEERKFGKHVKILNSLPPDDGNAYMVMLHSEGCQHCVELAPVYDRAAELGEGICTWSSLDCGDNYTACKSLNTQILPRILYFKGDKHHEYIGEKTSRLYVDWASNFLNNTSIYVTSKNFTVEKYKKLAILFTEKNPQPKIWNALENIFKFAGIKFLYSNDRNILYNYNLTHFPGVYLKKEKHDFIFYPHKLLIREAKKFFQEYFRENEL